MKRHASFRLASLSLAALAVAMSSCSQDEPLGYTAQENYTRAFISEFGLIDPDHTWGFGAAPASRAVDTNGNEWYRPEKVSQTEREKVAAYVSSNGFGKGLVTCTLDPADFVNYYVCHVVAVEHKYTDGDGNTFVGCKQMDYFMIAETTDAASAADVTGFTPINDFNKSNNSDYNGNMLLVNSGAYDFAYHSSRGNACDPRRYVIVPGSVIDKSLRDYKYLCFDYMSDGTGVKTNISVKYTYALGEQTATIKVSGAYTDPNRPTDDELKTLLGASLGRNIISIVEVTNRGLVDNDAATNFEVKYVAESDLQTENIQLDGYYKKSDTETWPTESKFKDILADYGKNACRIDMENTSVTQYVNGNSYVLPDGIYDDWIIRLVGPAVRKGDPKTYRVDPEDLPDDPDFEKRIMVEDLSVTASGYLVSNSSDWDFNDVVLDATIDASGKASIKLLALGGTLPIYIQDPSGNLSQELHSYFGCSSTTMINTGGVSRPAVDITDRDEIKAMTFGTGTDKYNTIRIFVDVNKDGNLVEVVAPNGQAPGKICIPVTVDWAVERQHVNNKWGMGPDGKTSKFKLWVGDENQPFWENHPTNQ